MDKQYTEQFHKNFIIAINQVLVDNSEELKNVSDVAKWLNVGKVTLYKIMDNKQAPTVEQGITLCKKGGFNANWIFLNIGAMKMQEQVTLNDIATMVKGLSIK